MISGDSRSEVVARKIAEMARSLPSGARLGSKAELQAQVDVSEGTFNTTLRLLQARGLVRVKSGPGGGVFVSEQSSIARLGNAVLQLDSDDVDVAEAIQVRNALEYEIVADACAHRTEAHLAVLAEAFHDMTEALDVQDEGRFVHANWRLHRQIANITPNTTLKSLYLGLLGLIEQHTLSVVAAAGENLHAFHESRLQLHEELIRVIVEQDKRRATDAVRSHNLGVR